MNQILNLGAAAILLGAQAWADPPQAPSMVVPPSVFVVPQPAPFVPPPQVPTPVVISQPYYGALALQCAWNGSNYEPYNSMTRAWLGIYGDGYSQAGDCQQAVMGDGGGAVCSWNGTNYQPYADNSGAPVGIPGDGFSALSGCVHATQSARNGMACTWNGSNYQPYSIMGSRPVGIPGNGFNNIDDCIQVVQNASGGALCQWDGSNYQPYNVQTNQPVGIPGYGFNQLADCQSSVSASRGGFACNWNGNAYQPYPLMSGPAPSVPFFPSLRDCNASLGGWGPPGPYPNGGYPPPYPNQNPYPNPNSPPQPSGLQISVLASDASDTLTERYWQIYDKYPAAYTSNGNYGFPPLVGEIHSSGDAMSAALQTYSRTFWFVITQSGGPSRGSYSGTITVNGRSSPFSGVDAMHPFGFSF